MCSMFMGSNDFKKRLDNNAREQLVSALLAFAQPYALLPAPAAGQAGTVPAADSVSRRHAFVRHASRFCTQPRESTALSLASATLDAQQVWAGGKHCHQLRSGLHKTVWLTSSGISARRPM